MNPAHDLKFNPITGKLETRGRKRKAAAVEPEPELHWRTQAAHNNAAPKIEAVMAAIVENFGSMRIFLRSWNNHESHARTQFFNNGGAAEMVQSWLLIIVAKGIDIQVVEDLVESILDREASVLVGDTKSVLRYSCQGGGITVSLDEMQACIKSKGPMIWKFQAKLVRGMVPKPNEAYTTISAVLQLLNCWNQQVNALQTITAVFLYANHVNKSAIKVLSELNVCCLYSHMNEVLKRIARDMRQQLWDETKLGESDDEIQGLEYVMKLILDNVNKFTGVQDGSSICQEYMNNSTSSYATTVTGLPQGMRYIPRDWAKIGA